MHQQSHHLPTLLFTLTLAFASGAQAGTIANGAWIPSGCGVKPEAPGLNLKNTDSFNNSVDGVNTYRQNIRTYVDCVVKEANADIQAVTQSATATQQAARAANEKIQADVKAANEKFK